MAAVMYTVTLATSTPSARSSQTVPLEPTTVAGFVKDADFVPVMAGWNKRQVLFSRELSVALHLGYYQRQIEIRMKYV